MEDSVSVYHLITKLCETHINNKYIGGQINKENVRKARSKCYEILLSKKSLKSNQYLHQNSDPLCNLLAWHFNLVWEGNVPQHAKKLELCLQKLQEYDIFKNRTYSNVVLFLLQLRSTPTVQHKIMDTTLNRDALLRYKKDRLIDDSRFHFPHNIKENLNSEQFTLPKDIQCTHSSFKNLYETCESKSGNGNNKSQKLQNLECRDDGYESPSKDADNIWEIAFYEPRNNHLTWETFGKSSISKELPFVCEAESKVITWLYNLTSLEKAVIGTNANIKKTSRNVSQKEFIKCVKYLLVGIESHIFTYNMAEELILVPDINIEGLSTCAITSYCKDLINCGACYKGLNTLCTTCPIDSKNEQNGYIFLELCGSIKRYLAYYRIAVLSLSDNSPLLTIHQQTHSLRKHITLLASVCKVGPFKESGEIPHGVTLLNYLYQKVTSLITEESLMVFYSVIYPCCKVYFGRFIQQWILEGSVCDPYGEFFININSKYVKSRGRTFWTRSFTLREDIVPEFLADLRQDIIFCGKAMNLLKLCVPNSALCLYLIEKQPNVLHCCLTPEQLAAVEHNNYCYYLETTVLSGPRLSLEDLFCRAREQNTLFLHLVSRKRAATLSRIELERKKILQLEFEQKQSEMKVLKDQYYEALTFKSITLATNLEKEIQSIENNVKLQILQNKIVEEEKTRLIEYYNKLSAVSEKRFNYYKRQIENLKCKLNDTPEPELSVETVESSSDSTESTASFHSLCTENKTKDNFEIALTDSSSLVTINDSCNVINKELDIINANTNENDTQSKLVLESYKQYIENKKAAEKNKAKVLYQEMGVMFNPITTKNQDMPELSEAQKNKLKVMSSEFGIGIGTLDKKILRSNSAAEKNRDKMLSSNVCFNNYQAYDDSKTHTKCDNENYINRNVDEIDTNTNIMETLNNNLSESTELDDLIENFSKPALKKRGKLSLDFSKLESKTNNEKLLPATLLAPKFELQKLSPMSIDSASISSVTTPNLNVFDNLKSSPAVTTAKTEAFSEPPFIFESDSLMMVTNFEKRKSQYASDEQQEISLSQLMDAGKINPGYLKFCLQQSVLIPLITQIQLVTNELLKYYINDLHYLEHLNSLRNYFFLLDGEFCRNITEGLFRELYDVNFPIDLINVHTLQILVHNALDYSTKFQEYSNCLSFKINNLPKVFNLCDPDVFDCLSLVYKVSWPLNILLPMDTISKYDDIFKLLLKVHRVSWVLHNVFLDLKLLTKEIEKQYRVVLMTSNHYLRLQHYRHIMTQFIQSLQNYIVGEVLQSSWHIFKKNLEMVKSFDQLYVLHSTYIKNILFLCLLNQKSAPLRSALQKIFIVILKFYSYLRSRSWSISDDNVYVHPNFNKLETLFHNFVELVLYFFKLGHKVVKSGYQPQLMQLLDMLDVNNYYSKRICNSLNISSVT